MDSVGFARGGGRGGGSVSVVLLNEEEEGLRRGGGGGLRSELDPCELGIGGRCGFPPLELRDAAAIRPMAFDTWGFDAYALYNTKYHVSKKKKRKRHDSISSQAMTHSSGEWAGFWDGSPEASGCDGTGKLRVVCQGTLSGSHASRICIGTGIISQLQL